MANANVVTERRQLLRLKRTIKAFESQFEKEHGRQSTQVSDTDLHSEWIIQAVRKSCRVAPVRTMFVKPLYAFLVCRRTSQRK